MVVQVPSICRTCGADYFTSYIGYRGDPPVVTGGECDICSDARRRNAESYITSYITGSVLVDSYAGTSYLGYTMTDALDYITNQVMLYEKTMGYACSATAAFQNVSTLLEKFNVKVYEILIGFNMDAATDPVKEFVYDTVYIVADGQKLLQMVEYLDDEHIKWVNDEENYEQEMWFDEYDTINLPDSRMALRLWMD